MQSADQGTEIKAMKDKLHVHCAPLKTCRCVLIQPASLVGKQRLNFGKALVVVENCAKPVLHNMHMSHVKIWKFSKPVILYVKVPSTYIYMYIYICIYIYRASPPAADPRSRVWSKLAS